MKQSYWGQINRKLQITALQIERRKTHRFPGQAGSHHTGLLLKSLLHDLWRRTELLEK